MRRREIFKAVVAGVVLGVMQPNKAGAQSKPQRKDPKMEGLAVITTPILVEHITIPSRKSFETVKTDLEALVPPIDESVFALLQQGDVERVRGKLGQAAELSIFGVRDHGALLNIHGLQRRALRYDIGNPLTAASMTQHQLSAALYAPVRVLLRESVEGSVAFEYDRPASVFGQFNDAEVNAVAQELDRHLKAVLQRAAA